MGKKEKRKKKKKKKRRLPIAALSPPGLALRWAVQWYEPFLRVVDCGGWGVGWDRGVGVGGMRVWQSQPQF